MSKSKRTLRAPPAKTPPDVDALRQFVKNPEGGSRAKTVEQATAKTGPMVHFNTRLAPDVDEALRRASLERKLRKEQPNGIQDIVDAALRGWLEKEGYLGE